MKWKCTFCVKHGYDTENPNPCEFIIEGTGEANFIIPVFCPFGGDLVPEWCRVEEGDKHLGLWRRWLTRLFGVVPDANVIDLSNKEKNL